ncbi:T9SS type A sorting domain-containing protein, partial [Rhodocaloribacter sp.]
FAFSPVVELTVDLPEPYRLTAAFPNPFNPRTSFELIVRRSQRVTVNVFDVLGRRVATLFDGTMAANETRSFSFDGAGLPSGLYLYRAEGETFSATRQALLLK